MLYASARCKIPAGDGWSANRPPWHWGEGGVSGSSSCSTRAPSLARYGPTAFSQPTPIEHPIFTERPPTDVDSFHITRHAACAELPSDAWHPEALAVPTTAVSNHSPANSRTVSERRWAEDTPRLPAADVAAQRHPLRRHSIYENHRAKCPART